MVRQEPGPVEDLGHWLFDVWEHRMVDAKRVSERGWWRLDDTEKEIWYALARTARKACRVKE